MPQFGLPLVSVVTVSPVALVAQRRRKPRQFMIKTFTGEDRINKSISRDGYYLYSYNSNRKIKNIHECVTRIIDVPFSYALTKDVTLKFNYCICSYINFLDQYTHKLLISIGHGILIYSWDRFSYYRNKKVIIGLYYSEKCIIKRNNLYYIYIAMDIIGVKNKNIRRLYNCINRWSRPLDRYFTKNHNIIFDDIKTNGTHNFPRELLDIMP